MPCDLGQPDARLVAFVTFNQSGADIAALKSWLTKQLPTYMVPADLIELPSLPLTPSGKIDRQALKAAIPASSDAPANEHERWFVAQFEALLQQSPVKVEDSLLLLGGSSLHLATLQSAIEETYAVNLGFATLVAAATPRKLAHELALALEQQAELETSTLLI